MLAHGDVAAPQLGESVPIRDVKTPCEMSPSNPSQFESTRRLSGKSFAAGFTFGALSSQSPAARENPSPSLSAPRDAGLVHPANHGTELLAAFAGATPPTNGACSKNESPAG